MQLWQKLLIGAESHPTLALYSLPVPAKMPATFVQVRKHL